MKRSVRRRALRSDDDLLMDRAVLDFGLDAWQSEVQSLRTRIEQQARTIAALREQRKHWQTSTKQQSARMEDEDFPRAVAFLVEVWDEMCVARAKISQRLKEELCGFLLEAGEDVDMADWCDPIRYGIRSLNGSKFWTGSEWGPAERALSFPSFEDADNEMKLRAKISDEAFVLRLDEPPTQESTHTPASKTNNEKKYYLTDVTKRVWTGCSWLICEDINAQSVLMFNNMEDADKEAQEVYKRYGRGMPTIYRKSTVMSKDELGVAIADKGSDNSSSRYAIKQTNGKLYWTGARWSDVADAMKFYTFTAAETELHARTHEDVACVVLVPHNTRYVIEDNNSCAWSGAYWTTSHSHAKTFETRDDAMEEIKYIRRTHPGVNWTMYVITLDAFKNRLPKGSNWQDDNRTSTSSRARLQQAPRGLVAESREQ